MYRVTCLGFLSLVVAACGDSGATGMDLAMGNFDLSTTTGPDMTMTASPDMTCVPPAPYKEDVSACKPATTDYQPRVNMSKDDAWAACISDDNTYHKIGMSISTIARVAAFESMAKKLWDKPTAPTPQDFVDARVEYAVDQGLDSRVQRRVDIHYPALPSGTTCQDQGVPAMYPDRCAGPAKILPIINDAFQKGAAGTEPRVQAARIEAALLWFLYLSTMSESDSCRNNAPDCDSCFAYYGGGGDRGAPLGFGRYVKAIAKETHDRAFDGILAVRCWRNLDNESGMAMNATLQKQAQVQLDKAALRGAALIARERLGKVKCSTGDVQAAHFAFVKTLLPFLDRGARAVDPAKADVVKAAAGAATPDALDVAATQSALDALFPCP